MLKYGLIAISAILPRFVKGLTLSKDSKAIAVSSRSLNKAQKFADEHNLEYYYDDYHQLLLNQEIDIVYISSTNKTHHQIAKDALMANKHVILEKPFTVTYQEALELVSLAKEKDLFLMEGQKVVFLPTTMKIKELIKEGVLGDLEYIYLPASANYGFSPDSWMNDYYEAGGALMGSGSYALSFVSFITDSSIIEAQCLENHEKGKADHLTSLSFKTESGVICNAILGGKINTVNRCYIYGSNGHIYLDNYWKSRAITLELKGQKPQIFDFPYESEFTFYIDHISDLFKDNKIESDIMPHYLSLEAMFYLDHFHQLYQGNLDK